MKQWRVSWDDGLRIVSAFEAGIYCPPKGRKPSQLRACRDKDFGTYYERNKSWLKAQRIKKRALILARKKMYRRIHAARIKQAAKEYTLSGRRKVANEKQRRRAKLILYFVRDGMCPACQDELKRRLNG